MKSKFNNVNYGIENLIEVKTHFGDLYKAIQMFETIADKYTEWGEDVPEEVIAYGDEAQMLVMRLNRILRAMMHKL